MGGEGKWEYEIGEQPAAPRSGMLMAASSRNVRHDDFYCWYAVNSTVVAPGTATLHSSGLEDAFPVPHPQLALPQGAVCLHVAVADISATMFTKTLCLARVHRTCMR